MIQFLIHEKADTVGVATVDIETGETAKGLCMDSQENIEVKALQDIPLGHKIALADMKMGDTVIKYGNDIGKALSRACARGKHVTGLSLSRSDRFFLMSMKAKMFSCCFWIIFEAEDPPALLNYEALIHQIIDSISRFEGRV